MKVDYELIGYSEIDKYASKAYSLIHNVSESLNLGDITKIDEVSISLPVDLITYGFPCQDISIAGGQQGLFNEDGTKTRSGLFFDALRVIEHTQPKVAIAENVKNLTSKKFEKQFNIVLNSLEDSGYNNYWQVLNSKDYGIPQNRERVFIVSIRKDIDTGIFEFPEPFELDKRLKDLLEDEVEDKFYISDYSSIRCLNGEKITPNPTVQSVGNINPSGNGMNGNVFSPSGVSPTLTTNKGEGNKIIELHQVGDLEGGKWDKIHQIHKRVYSDDGIAPTIHTVAGGNTERKVIIGSTQAHAAISTDGIVPTLTSSMGTGGGHVPMHNYDFKIRKLTPRECFRLMGFEDSDWQVLVDNKISNSQLYKMAGNSIVVDVAEELLCMILDDNNELYV